MSEILPGPRVDEADAIETLLDWITIEFAACISGAVLEGELLEEGVRRSLAHRGSDVLAAERAPHADETLEMLQTVRESFRRLHEVQQAVRVLSGSDASGSVPLAPICQALSCLVQSRAVPVADVALEGDATCATTTRPGKLVAALVLLVNDVLDRAAHGASPPGKRVRITLRTRTVGGAAAIEVEHDLDGAAGDTQTEGPLPHVCRVLRGDGAEVELSSAPGKTLVRLLLPLAELSPAALQGPGPARASRSW